MFNTAYHGLKMADFTNEVHSKNSFKWTCYKLKVWRLKGVYQAGNAITKDGLSCIMGNVVFGA